MFNSFTLISLARCLLLIFKYKIPYSICKYKNHYTAFLYKQHRTYQPTNSILIGLLSIYIHFNYDNYSIKLRFYNELIIRRLSLYNVLWIKMKYIAYQANAKLNLCTNASTKLHKHCNGWTSSQRPHNLWHFANYLRLYIIVFRLLLRLVRFKAFAVCAVIDIWYLLQTISIATTMWYFSEFLSVLVLNDDEYLKYIYYIRNSNC